MKSPSLPLNNKIAILAALLLCTLICVSAVAPWLPIPSPLAIDLSQRLQPPQLSSGGHWLGTDQLGRDMFSRLVFGSRVTLTVCAATIAIGGVFGVGIGLLAGYLGGWPDRLLMRVLDMQLATPTLLLALLVLAAMGSSLSNLILIMSLASWTQYARLVRGQVRVTLNQDYIQAARSIGAQSYRIILRHVLPNIWGSIVVVVALELARVILMEASLSFLGLGVPPPFPSWGRMLAEGRSYMADGWWIMMLPGLAIVLTVLSINILGDKLRDHCDPKGAA